MNQSVIHFHASGPLLALVGNPDRVRGVAEELTATTAPALVWQVKLLVVVRYTSALREADSVLIRGLRHNIRYIKNVDFDNKWLEIDVEGGVAV